MNRYEILLNKEQKKKCSYPVQYKKIIVGGRASGKTSMLIKEVRAFLTCGIEPIKVYLNHYQNVRYRWMPQHFPNNVHLKPLHTSRAVYMNMSGGIFFDDFPLNDCFYMIAELVQCSSVKNVVMTCDFDVFMNFTAKDKSLFKYLYNSWLIDQLKWPCM